MVKIAIAVIIALVNPAAVMTQTQIDPVAILREAGWPEDQLENALAVINCETGGTFDPNIEGDGGAAKGWFQIHWDYDLNDKEAKELVENGYWAGWYPWAKLRLGYEGSWNNPLDNARLALIIYDRSGWDPWSCWDLINAHVPLAVIPEPSSLTWPISSRSTKHILR